MYQVIINNLLKILHVMAAITWFLVVILIMSTLSMCSCLNIESLSGYDWQVWLVAVCFGIISRILLKLRKTSNIVLTLLPFIITFISAYLINLLDNY